MKLKGRAKGGEVRLHSRDSTFCAVDVYPSELFSQPDTENQLISYTGVIVPQPEYFSDFVQWKDTDGLDHRLTLLRKILSLVQNETYRKVLCFSIHTTKSNGWKLGHLILSDILTNGGRVKLVTTKKGNKYQFDDKVFGEIHAVSMSLYAFVIVNLFQHIAREVTKAKSLESLKKPLLQFLLDNVSGDPSDRSLPRWHLDLILYIIENTRLMSILLNGMSKSCFSRYGIETPMSNEMEGDVYTGSNQIPLMIASDWFAKICSRYKALNEKNENLDEDDSLMLEIVKTLSDRKSIISQTLPSVESFG